MRPAPSRRRGPFLVAALLASFVIAAGAGGVAATPEGPLEVDYANGALSLRAEHVPLARVLSAVAEEADFRLLVEGDLNRPITRSLARVPLDRGLERLLDGVSYLRIYESFGGRPVLAELRVLASPVGENRAPMSAVELRQAPRTAPTPAQTARLEAAEEERLRRVRRLQAERGSDVAQELSLYLQRDPSATVRRIAAAGLARQGGIEARAALTAALEDADSQVRRQALLALAQRWGPEAGPALAGALANDPDAEARAMAARMLGQTGGAEAEGALEAALQDLDPKVRQLARQSLARLEVRQD